MFQTLASPKKRPAVSITGSLLLQLIAVFVFLYHAPIFVKPSSVAWGQKGRSEALVYLAQARVEPATPAPKRLLPQLKPKRKSPPQIVKSIPEPARAGSPIGSLYHGPGSGSEARPALPLVFPDPAIYPWQLPKGLQGDVIVEVTIDEQGSVTNTRVLQSLQQDVDEKVIATLRNWRFKPATVDGTAISSRQDVHFHFPS
jgi:TonB family protein